MTAVQEVINSMNNPSDDDEGVGGGGDDNGESDLEYLDRGETEEEDNQVISNEGEEGMEDWERALPPRGSKSHRQSTSSENQMSSPPRLHHWSHGAPKRMTATSNVLLFNLESFFLTRL